MSSSFYLVSIVQVILALGLLNVWLLRFNQRTAYRGSDAHNMKEEFRAYGLPSGSVYFIGALKLLCAFGLLAAFWIPELLLPSGVLLSALMIGAIAMHLKVRDPLIRSLPAVCMLSMAIFVLFFSPSA